MDTLKRGMWYRTASGSERDKDATFAKVCAFNHGITQLESWPRSLLLAVL